MEDQSLILNERGQIALRRAGYWGRFMSVLGFISAVLMIILGLFMFLAGSIDFGDGAGIPYPVVGGIYLAIGIIQFVASLLLWQFSDKVDLAIKTEDTQLLGDGLQKLMVLFRFLVLTTVISIALFVLSLFATILLTMLSL